MHKPVGKNKYEKCIWGIFHNATYKLLSALELYKAGLQNESFFLTVIAEEELSKLTMIPIANEIGELDELFSNRNNGKSPYFNHRKKQKIFTTFSLFDREDTDVEDLKQSCLYIGLGKSDYPEFIKIKKTDLNNELIWAICFFIDNIKKIKSTPLLSEYIKKPMEGFYLNNLLFGAINSLAPNIGKEVNKEMKKRADDLKKQDPLVISSTLFLSNTFAVVEFFKAKYKNDYKEHLKRLYGLSFIEIGEYIISLNKKKRSKD
jgi:hypothetical protein